MSISDVLFRKITDDSMIGLLVFKKTDLVCVYANSMARNILEYTEEDISALSLHRLYSEQETPPFRLFSEKMLQYEGIIEDVMVQKINGSSFIAGLGIRLLQEDGHEYVMIMLQDVTYQKKLQREVAIKQEEIKKTYEEMLGQNLSLKELDKAKNKFIALITHELRTPLSAIIATAEFLHLKFYENEKQLEEFIGTIVVEGQHLLAIINDILDFSKIQTGKMDIFLENADPSELIQKQIESLQKMAEGNEVQLHFDPCPDNPECFFDPLRLNQVVANVLSNAIKFNKKGGSVLIQMTSKEKTIEICIEDEGSGIPKKFEDKVFDEFETLENIKSHHKGTGLGMPISKKLIEAMGGTIHFTSEEGIGTKFFINIPKEKVCNDDLYKARPDQGTDFVAA
jgi:PAS domain S-box-containing protein